MNQNRPCLRLMITAAFCLSVAFSISASAQLRSSNPLTGELLQLQAAYQARDGKTHRELSHRLTDDLLMVSSPGLRANLNFLLNHMNRYSMEGLEGVTLSLYDRFMRSRDYSKMQKAHLSQRLRAYLNGGYGLAPNLLMPVHRFDSNIVHYFDVEVLLSLIEDMATTQVSLDAAIRTNPNRDPCFSTTATKQNLTPTLHRQRVGMQAQPGTRDGLACGQGAHSGDPAMEGVTLGGLSRHACHEQRMDALFANSRNGAPTRGDRFQQAAAGCMEASLNSRGNSIGEGGDSLKAEMAEVAAKRKAYEGKVLGSIREDSQLRFNRNSLGTISVDIINGNDQTEIFFDTEREANEFLKIATDILADEQESSPGVAVSDAVGSDEGPAETAEPSETLEATESTNTTESTETTENETAEAPEDPQAPEIQRTDTSGTTVDRNSSTERGNPLDPGDIDMSNPDCQEMMAIMNGGSPMPRKGKDEETNGRPWEMISRPDESGGATPADSRTVGCGTRMDGKYDGGAQCENLILCPMGSGLDQNCNCGGSNTGVSQTSIEQMMREHDCWSARGEDCGELGGGEEAPEVPLDGDPGITDFNF